MYTHIQKSTCTQFMNVHPIAAQLRKQTLTSTPETLLSSPPRHFFPQLPPPAPPPLHKITAILSSTKMVLSIFILGVNGIRQHVLHCVLLLNIPFVKFIHAFA